MQLDTFPFVVSFQGRSEQKEALCELFKIYAESNRERLAVVLIGINSQSDIKILKRLGLEIAKVNDTSALLENNFLEGNQFQKNTCFTNSFHKERNTIPFQIQLFTSRCSITTP